MGIEEVWHWRLLRCRIRKAAKPRRGGAKISFDTGEALTITLIGIGTAFSLLMLLSLFTAILPRVANLGSGSSSSLPSEEETLAERNKALAATIAVTVAMSRGHLPDESGDSN